MGTTHYPQTGSDSDCKNSKFFSHLMRARLDERHGRHKVNMIPTISFTSLRHSSISIFKMGDKKEEHRQEILSLSVAGALVIEG